MADSSNFKRILVTGGAGFIGSEYVRSAISGTLYGGIPKKVQVLDLLTYAGDIKRLAEVSSSSIFEFIQGSINDIYLVDQLVSKTDAIVHFAAESHVDRSILNSTKFVETNVLGTNVLLDAANKYNKTIILVSTDEVYGSLANGLATEKFPLCPSSPYSASKSAGDLIGLAFHFTHGLDVRVTRSVNNYGKFQNTEKLIPKSIKLLASGKPIELYGDGKNVRNWLHITDHCEAIARVLHLGEPGEIYNIGSEESFTNLELANSLINLINPGIGAIKFIEERLGHDYRYAVDSSKIRTLLDWVPKHNFEESLDEVIQSINSLD